LAIWAIVLALSSPVPLTLEKSIAGIAMEVKEAMSRTQGQRRRGRDCFYCDCKWMGCMGGYL
jgi:hypothetical protein